MIIGWLQIERPIDGMVILNARLFGGENRARPANSVC